jgi:aspartyl-tRNA(Asn)/glutamyl-tRNA(Gln) amidotransferase subunit C
MAITRADVEKIAGLAMLDLSAEEVDLFTENLRSILGYVEKLNELDTSDVSPMSHCSSSEEDQKTPTREDIVQGSLGQRLAVENAPDSDGKYFKVPKVIQG